MYWFFLLFTVIISFVVTGLVRSYAIKSNLMDIPNERSSHGVPTPRGGGVAVVLTLIATFPFLHYLGLLRNSILLVVLGAGAFIAIVGFIDDHGHVKARWRLFAHFAVSLVLTVWFGGLPEFVLFDSIVVSRGIGFIFSVFYLVWVLNLYNFMDGIDGIAGIEAVTVCISGAIVLKVSGYADQATFVSILIFAAAVLGFLFWNLSSSRIFIGDAGSGFIGISLGIFSLHMAWLSPKLFWAWLILLGAFIVDATVTLFRRVYRGETFYLPHRTHAYQYASRFYGSHSLVSFGFGAINLFWLLPLAILVVVGHLNGIVAICVAYVPLVALAYRFKAGAHELQDF